MTIIDYKYDIHDNVQTLLSGEKLGLITMLGYSENRAKLYFVQFSDMNIIDKWWSEEDLNP